MKLKKFVPVVITSAAIFVSSSHSQVQFQQSGNQVPGVVVNNQSLQQGLPPGATSMQQVTEADRAKTDIGAEVMDSGTAIAVRSCFTNGPAHKAGLQSGDTITKANGQAVPKAAAFKAMVQGMKPGDSVKLTISRSGAEKEVELKLMTLGEIVAASIVPEPGVYDQAVTQAEQQKAKLAGDIKTMETDLEDMKKRLAAMDTQIADLKAKAETARVAAEQKKKEEAARRAEELKKQAEAAEKQAQDAAPIPGGGTIVQPGKSGDK